MGGGDYHLGEKPDSIFLLCQNIGLSLFGVCLFFGGFWCIEKLGRPREKKILLGRLGLDPLFVVLELPAVQKLGKVTVLQRKISLGRQLRQI